MTKQKSEFGQGLTYCLGLFLAHKERIKEYEKLQKSIGMDHPYNLWFNGAADHLYDLQIPEFLPADIQLDLRTLYDKSMGWRLSSNVTKENFDWAIDLAFDLLRRIDEYFKVLVIVADND